MKDREVYELVERLLDPPFASIGFERHPPPRANWFKQIQTRFLRLLIEIHHKSKWTPYSGGAFNIWMGFANDPKQCVIAPEDGFSFDTFLDETMLQKRTKVRNRVNQKIISTATAHEVTQSIKNTTDDLLRFEMKRGIHRNCGGRCNFYDVEDIEGWCAMISEMLPHIIKQAETRLTEGLAYT